VRILGFTVPENNRREWGVQIGDRVYSGVSLAPTLDDFVKLGEGALEELRAIAAPGRAPDYAMSEIRLEAPLQRPGKIMAIGRNYLDHCRETGSPVPERPILFAKFPSSVIGPSDEIRWHMDVTKKVDWEVELGVVIGETARRVSQEEALDHVFGYTVVNDVSARDLQFSDGQWVRAKSLDTFCPLGPAVVTADEIPDPQNLGLRSWVNGEVMQDSNTSEMIFDVRFLVSFLSRAFTLYPGDIIATGTPHGVGLGRDPQVFLDDGDVVEMEIDRIGRMRNVCRVED